MPLGTHGKVRFYGSGKEWRARTLYRDYDGVTRDVERSAASKAAAERALKEALRDRVRVGAIGDIGPETKLEQVGEAWWAEYSLRQDRSPLTLQAYRQRLDRQILPALGRIRMRELSTGTVERFLRAVESRHGAALAKTTRNVLSNICSFAARHDAIDRNPVRETSSISVKPKKGLPRALTIAQLRQLLAMVSYDEQAIARDLPDLVAFLASTGTRIGEALALEWTAFDFGTSTVEIGATVIRIKGGGLVAKPRPKTEAEYRGLVIPSWCAERFASRKEGSTSAYVFPSTAGTLRDPSNVIHQLRDAFITAGFDITPHTIRKTVATAMKNAGLMSIAVADQLGHADVGVTESVYFGRKVADTGAAAVLEALSV
jgi:integrase